jgi:hypothetical protein
MRCSFSNRLLAVALLLCVVPTAQAIRCPTPALDSLLPRLNEEMPAPEPGACYVVWVVDSQGRIGLFVGNNPISNVDPLGLWNLWNPATWGDENPSGWSVVNSLTPWHESSGYTWEGIKQTTSEADAAFLDGLIPFADPFEDLYDPSDKSLQCSKRIGAWTRDAELTLAYGVAKVPTQLVHFTTAAGARGIATDGFIEGGYGLFNPVVKGVYMTTVGRSVNLFVPAASTIPIAVIAPAWTARIIPYLVYLKAGARVGL